MRRRDLLRTGAGSLAAVAGLSLLPRAGATAEAATPAGRPQALPDADTMAARAHEVFMPGKKTCCEAMLQCGCEALGIDSDLVPDIALGLGGGIGLQGKTCGAITGASLVLSLAVAQREKDYKKKKMAIMQATASLYKQFAAKQGCTTCRELIKLDLTKVEDRKTFEAREKAKTCDPVVQHTARLLHAELAKIAQG